jgi:hypothetical protein
MKKTVLELGVSDPFIVMTSANPKEAVTNAVNARTINNGQSCNSAKRFIVQQTMPPTHHCNVRCAFAAVKSVVHGAFALLLLAACLRCCEGPPNSALITSR